MRGSVFLPVRQRIESQSDRVLVREPCRLCVLKRICPVRRFFVDEYVLIRYLSLDPLEGEEGMHALSTVLSEEARTAALVCALIALAWLLPVVRVPAGCAAWLQRQLRRFVHPDLAQVRMLGSWLELEAERCKSLDLVWAEFEMLLGKLGFSSVRIESGTEQRQWHSTVVLNSHWPLAARYSVGRREVVVLEFVASRAVMDPDDFEYISRTLAKAWFRAGRYCVAPSCDLGAPGATCAAATVETIASP
jgi:hypothetical protein